MLDGIDIKLIIMLYCTRRIILWLVNILKIVRETVKNADSVKSGDLKPQERINGLLTPDDMIIVRAIGSTKNAPISRKMVKDDLI